MPCIICESSDYLTVRRGVWDIVGVGERNVSFDICRDCGHIGQFNPVSSADMLGYYEAFSNYQVLDPDYRVADVPNKKTSRYLRIAEDGHPSPGRIYEVGCASGVNLHYFRQVGWEVGGCEPSRLVAEQARTYHDIAVDIGGEEECLPGIDPVDIVMFAHVLEHLHDPVSALKRAAECLAPGGHILFEVPCSVRPELLPPGWFTFEHLSYFTPETVQNLISKAGLVADETFVTMIDEYPAITVLARPSGIEPPLFNSFKKSLQFCEAYNELDYAIWAGHEQTMRKTTKDVFVWGAGNHTAQLFDETDILKTKHVIAIIDSDFQKWGRRQSRKQIIPPGVFINAPGEPHVIISSLFAEQDILKTLLKAGVARERIITLYC